jgi:predicted transporter
LVLNEFDFDLKQTLFLTIFATPNLQTSIMGMNKNTVLGWATLIMILMGLLLIGLGIFKYSEISGWGFVTVGVGFLANAWVFNALKGRL